MAEQLVVIFEFLQRTLSYHFFVVTAIIAVTFNIQDNIAKAQVAYKPNNVKRPNSWSDFNFGGGLVTGSFIASIYHTNRMLRTTFFDEQVSAAPETLLFGILIPMPERYNSLLMCVAVCLCLLVARTQILKLYKKGNDPIYKVTLIYCPVEHRFRYVDSYGGNCGPDQLRLKRNQVLAHNGIGLAAFAAVLPLTYL